MLRARLVPAARYGHGCVITPSRVHRPKAFSAPHGSLFPGIALVAITGARAGALHFNRAGVFANLARRGRAILLGSRLIPAHRQSHRHRNPARRRPRAPLGLARARARAGCDVRAYQSPRFYFGIID